VTDAASGSPSIAARAPALRALLEADLAVQLRNVRPAAPSRLSRGEFQGTYPTARHPTQRSPRVRSRLPAAVPPGARRQGAETDRAPAGCRALAPLVPRPTGGLGPALPPPRPRIAGAGRSPGARPCTQMAPGRHAVLSSGPSRSDHATARAPRSRARRRLPAPPSCRDRGMSPLVLSKGVHDQF
jgi:hypothetical protein